MNIYKYLIGYRIIMKNFQVVLLILFVFCLIPVSSAYSQETQPKDAVQISFQDLEYIEDSEDPHASAYVTIRNSDGELVGISHVHATKHLESTTLALFFEVNETIETLSIENQVFEMKQVRINSTISEQDCMFYREFLPCYYYSFATALGISYEFAGELFVNQAFSGLNHAYIAEEQDTVEWVWSILLPKN